MYKTRRLHATMLGLGTMLAATFGNPVTLAQTQLTEHTASDGAAGDNYGHSVGLSGNFAVVGAHQDDGLSGADQGGAYVLHWNGSAWNQVAKLTASDGGAGDLFGFSVAISGNVIVVGAPERGTNGAAYVFRWNGTTWVQEAVLTDVSAPAGSRIGDSVAIEGDRVVVGGTQTFVIGGGTGVAYLFERVLGSWVQQAELGIVAELAENGSMDNGDQFGWSVSISGDSVAVGARNDSDATSLSGAAFVFNYNGEEWLWQASIRPAPADANANDQFGSGVSISGNTLAIGAPGDGSSAGATYVYDRSEDVWSQTVKKVGFLSSAGDAEGWSVALQGDRLASGAYQRGGSYGAVHIYQFVGGTWTEDGASPVDDFDLDGFTELGDELGTSVSIDDDLILAGIPGKDLEGGESGSVLFFQAGNVAPNPDPDGDGLPTAMELMLQTMNGGSCPNPNDADSDNDTLSDGFENGYGTNMCSADSDGDGLNDNVEISVHLTNPSVADTDVDGVSDGAEITNATSPLDPDCDDDGLNDGGEIAYGTNPHDFDHDNDGMTDGQEVTAAAGSGCPNPLTADSDGDGYSDGIENTAPVLDPCDSDSDNDAISDGDEAGHGTNPELADTDGDGLLDGHEVAIAGAGTCPSPTDSDSDNDGISDGDEFTFGAGPCDVDIDDDGLSDVNEDVFDTNPFDSDSDNDGTSDGAEVDAAMGGGCPSPNDSDSDNDGLSDGAEATAMTHACDPDTDGDGLLDGADPAPLLPNVTPAILASMTFATAGEFVDTPVSQYLGANNTVRQVRRATLAATTALAAVAIQRGNYAAARALLMLVENLTDGVSPPADWMTSGTARTQVHNDVQTLITLLDLID